MIGHCVYMFLHSESQCLQNGKVCKHAYANWLDSQKIVKLLSICEIVSKGSSCCTCWIKTNTFTSFNNSEPWAKWNRSGACLLPEPAPTHRTFQLSIWECKDKSGLPYYFVMTVIPCSVFLRFCSDFLASDPSSLLLTTSRRTHSLVGESSVDIWDCSDSAWGRRKLLENNLLL